MPLKLIFIPCNKMCLLMCIYKIFINKHKLTVNETDLHIFTKTCFMHLYTTTC